MSDSTRVLILEDLPTDAELVMREVKRVLPGGEFHLVDTQEDYLAALMSFRPDVILSDYKLPTFDGLSALKLAIERVPETPFLIVTGSMNEDTAVDCMKAGAWDYVIKQQIKRLGPAVMAVLEQGRLRRERREAEAALRESEAQFRALAENSGDYIMRYDRDHRHVYANPSAIRVTGRTREEYIGKTHQEMGFPEHLCRLWEAAIDEVFLTSQVHEEVFEWESAEGTVYLDWRLFPEQDAQGAVQAVLGVSRDITKVKQSEEALRKSEATTSRLLRQQVMINELAVALGEHAALKEVYQTIHKHIQDLVDVSCFMISAFDEGAGLIRAEYAASERAYDVSVFPPIPLGEPGQGTQSRVIHSGQPLYSPDHQKSIEKSKNKYLIDSDGSVHREIPSGREQEDITRSVVYLPMKVGGRTVGVMQVQSRKLDAYSEQDIDLLSGMANVAAVSVQNARLHEEVVRELAERKRAEVERERLQAQLLQSQKMEAVGRLAGGVAHDFNNMLAVIMGTTEMALHEMAPTQPLYADLQEILGAAQRSADLTRQLLAFARQQPIAPRVLDLNDTVEGMLKMLRRLIGEDIDLAWMPRAGLWPVKMDPSQLDQLLANLCVNARDAISGIGKVTIETGQVTFDEAYCANHLGAVPGEYVRLAVSDDGCGMDADVQQHLFEPFFTTKGVGQGTGLGLATVYGIVKQNDGFVDVYSELGKGTTFRIYIPRDRSQLTLDQKTAEKPIPRGHGELILMVEDEPTILRMGQRMLQNVGYTVLTAGTPDDALRLAAENAGRIHLLITDVVMPGMSGKDLAAQLRSAQPELTCLFMSGYTSDVIAHRGVLDEGVSFIQKPFSMRDLALKVREVLNANATGSTD